MNGLKKEGGFSLIEVITAIVIIGIILLSFSQLFIQSHRIAYKNSEKLVTIHLADAMLERLKAGTFPYNASVRDVNHYFVDALENDPAKKNPPTLIIMNDKEYEISYEASQNSHPVKNANYSEAALQLVRVVVTVTAPDGKTKGSSEGYVALE